MIELKLADLKETFDYIKTTHIKELLNPFSVVVSYKNESYILRKLESEYKFFLEVSFIKEDNINYYYKIKCYDEKVGPRIEDEYSIRKKLLLLLIRMK